jgi:DNA polymerase
MRESHRRLLALEPQEAALFALTGRMNDAGVEVDIAALEPAQRLLVASSHEGEARFARLTGGPGMRSYARAAAALGLPNMKKPAVRRALRDGSTPPHVREALELYQRLARSSPAKLRAMQLRASPDGRCRGMLVYYGAAATGRWSGAGVQPQNFPRGLGEGTEQAFEALASGALELLYDDPVGTIADMLRGFFIGPLLVGDYAQIEARMLAWRAGQLDLVKVFADHGDPYSMMASRIYGRPINKHSTDPALPDGFTPRFLGKQVVLGCGYGMGPEKFRRMLSDIYDLDITAELAERAVATYRVSNGRILAYWKRLESAARYVLGTKKAVQVDAQTGMGLTRVGGIEYLFIHLPSGRKLYYCEPELSDDGIRYWGRNIYTGGKWERIGTYGGKLAENVTQALSRDIMASAMIRLDAAGFELLLTIHDEIVAKDNGLLPAFKEIMLTPPEWAKGLPLDVETFQAQRYRK